MKFGSHQLRSLYYFASGYWPPLFTLKAWSIAMIQQDTGMHWSRA